MKTPYCYYIISGSFNGFSQSITGKKIDMGFRQASPEFICAQ